jgi:hypothetical protein
VGHIGVTVICNECRVLLLCSVSVQYCDIA